MTDGCERSLIVLRSVAPAPVYVGLRWSKYSTHSTVAPLACCRVLRVCALFEELALSRVCFVFRFGFLPLCGVPSREPSGYNFATTAPQNWKIVGFILGVSCKCNPGRVRNEIFIGRAWCRCTHQPEWTAAMSVIPRWPLAIQCTLRISYGLGDRVHAGSRLPVLSQRSVSVCPQ